MRQANTTFVNLRAALDDVDPLVDASKPAAVQPAALPRLAPRGRRRRRADDPRPRRDRQALRRGQRPGRPDPDPAGPDARCGRLRLSRLRRGPGRPTSTTPPTTTSPRAPSASRSARLPTACRRWRSSAPTRPSSSAGSTGSRVAFGTAIDANGGSARVATIFNTFSVSAGTGLPIIGPGILPSRSPSRPTST